MTSQEGGASPSDGGTRVVDVRAAGRAPTPSGQPDPTLPPGTRVGRFVLERSIGAGGMGIVYQARDPRLDRDVALKLLRPRARSSPSDALIGLLEEARLTAALTHPNVVSVHECGTYDDGVFMAMELLDGETLWSWVEREAPPAAQILDAMLAVGAGLAAAHARGIVHHDVKPQNIIRTEAGSVKLVDFGIAERTDDADGSHDSILLGTPGYMPPEYFDHGRSGPALDQFAYCVTLHWLLYGCHPFASTRGDYRPAMRAGRLQALRPRFSTLSGYHRVLAIGLAPAPEDRHASMSALLDALARVRRRRRRALFVVSGLAVGGTALLAGRYGLQPSPSDLCERDLPGVRAQLGRERHAAWERLESFGDPIASSAKRRFGPRLDAWIDAWARRRSDACSVEPEDASRAEVQVIGLCLDRQAAEVGSLLRAIGEVDLASARSLTVQPLQLPDTDACRDLTVLAAQPPLPAEPQELEGVRALDELTHALSASLQLGDLDGARDLAARIEIAVAQVEYAPTVARADRSLARLHELEGNAAAALARVEAGLSWAERARAPALRVELWLLASRMYAWRGDAQAAQVALKAASAAAATLGGDPSTEHAITFARAEAALLVDDRETAASLYAELLEEDLPPREHDRVLFALGETTYGLRSAVEAVHWHERALEIREAAYGRDHPLVGESLSALGRVLKSVDVTRAERVLLEAIENLERAFGPQGLPVALALERLGSVKLRQGRADDALVVLERAVTIIEGHEGRAEFDTSIVWSRLGSALSALGRHDEALSAHREAHERLAAAFGPRHPRLSLPAMNRAYALQRAGRFGEAVTWFETAIDLLPLRSSRRRQRAMLQFELARVLWDSEIDRRRAVVEAAAAQRAFTPDDPPWDGIDRARIDDWLAARATDG